MNVTQQPVLNLYNNHANYTKTPPYALILHEKTLDIFQVFEISLINTNDRVS